jgi:lauroyl/myristoyl acyltransferase
LKAGGVVQIVNDMSYDEGNCLRKCVGGRWYDLKPGFAELALATGAAVLPVYCAFDSVGQVRMTILPALGPLADAAAHPARVHHLLDQYVAFLENAWRRAPESLGWGALRRYYSRPLVITNDRLSPISPA